MGSFLGVIDPTFTAQQPTLNSNLWKQEVEDNWTQHKINETNNGANETKP